jgi:predicted dehydrogenase
VEIDLDLMPHPLRPARSDYSIGAIGAGFIMRDVQLVAYQNAGFHVAGIASRNPERAREAAQIRGIPKAYNSIAELITAPGMDIFDIAVPPPYQLELVRQIVASGARPRGILAQKPLGIDLDEARDIVQLCENSGIVLAVNQNMRFDQSIRALKKLLQNGALGEPVLATIEMRAVPHWKPWAGERGRLTLLIMSIHHLDCFRYLFGHPASVYVSVRKDPRTKFAHEDGICFYILEYANGFRASAWDDVWTGPGAAGASPNTYIKWRAEGTTGVAEGTIGWPGYPNRQPSTIRYMTEQRPGVWIAPQWSEVWFPDAFEGPMAALMDAIATGAAPSNSGSDNLRTMELVEACYQSIREHRPIDLPA